MSSSPATTHVVSVGIGTYATMGERWWLEKAPEHAVRFAEWARGAGVLADNVHLFLSEADVGPFAARLAAINVTPHHATWASLREFAFNGMQGLNGELLLLSWSGHGGIGADSQQILYYSDVSLDAPLHLDLSYYLDMLKRKPHARFRRQIAFIDACASPYEQVGFRGALPVDRPSKLDPDTEIQQSFLYAAEWGQYADAGELSKNVLARLDAWRDSGLPWPPDYDAIIDELTSSYEHERRPVQLRSYTSSRGPRAGESIPAQLPEADFINSVARLRGYDVRWFRRLADVAATYERLNDIVARDAVYRAVLGNNASDQKVLSRKCRSAPRTDLLYIVATAFWECPDRLAPAVTRVEPLAPDFLELLERVRTVKAAYDLIYAMTVPPSELRDIYARAIGDLSAEPARSQAVALVDMLAELTEVRSVAAFGPKHLCRFLLLIADRYPAHRADIEAFVRDRGSASLLVDIKAWITAAKRFLLSIMIHPAFDAQRLPSEVEARLCDADSGTVEHVFERTPTTDWRQAREQVGAIVHAVRQIVKARYCRGDGDVEIEFLLPEAFVLFEEAPHRIPLNFVKAAAPPLLGKLFPVVVRLRDRILFPDIYETAPWEKAAARMRGVRSGKVRWLDVSQMVDLAKELEACSGLAVVQKSRSEDPQKLERFLWAGFPYVAWTRDGPVTEQSKQILETLVQTSLTNLPRELLRFRQTDNDWGTDLTLFWDDPARVEHWPLAEVAHD